jgi:hypothetical protein
MKMKKTIILMVLGAVVIGIGTFSVSADEDERAEIMIMEEEANRDDWESVTAPPPDSEPLIIAPNPEIIDIEQNAEKGEKVISAETTEGNTDSLIDLSNQDKNNKNSEKSQLAIFGIGGLIVILGLIGVIIYKKR